jgi:hypothetical protein
MREQRNERPMHELKIELVRAIQTHNVTEFYEIVKAIKAQLAREDAYVNRSKHGFSSIREMIIYSSFTESPLNIAVSCNFKEAVNYFIDDEGADAKKVSPSLIVPFDGYVKTDFNQDRKDIIDKLIKSGVSLEREALVNAIEYGLEPVNFILNLAPYLDKKGLLATAAFKSDDPELVRLFITENKDELNLALECMLRSLTSNSLSEGKMRILKLLLDAKVDPNCKCTYPTFEFDSVIVREGDSVINIAIHRQNKEAVLALVSAGAVIPQKLSKFKDIITPEFRQFMKELAQLKTNAQLIGLSARDKPDTARSTGFFSTMPHDLQAKIAAHTVDPNAIPEPTSTKIASDAIKDLRKAHVHFQDIARKAEAGDAAAQNFLGKLFEKGSVRFGIEKNEKNAVELYREAARQHNPQAQRNLARMYENGLGGLRKNSDLAQMWSKRAKDAEEYQKQLESKSENMPSVNEQQKIKRNEAQSSENKQPNRPKKK